MKILQSVKKIPGGLMVVPLLLGAVVNTFFGQVWTWYDGTFTTYLWKSGAMPILAVFLFCNGATIDFKRAVYRARVVKRSVVKRYPACRRVGQGVSLHSKYRSNQDDYRIHYIRHQ